MKFGRQVAVFQWSRLLVTLGWKRSIISFETFVLRYWTIWCVIPEDQSQ